MATDTTVMQSDLRDNKLTAPPRQRVAKLNSLTLMDTWQTLVFVEGSSTFNVNTFPENRWDYTNNKFVTNPAMPDMEQAFDLSFDMVFAVPVNTVKLQMRFVIPSATPYPFPYPDLAETERWLDVATVSVANNHKLHYEYSVYTNSALRASGCQIQLRYTAYSQNANLVSGLITPVLAVLTGTNRPSLTYCSLNIYAK